MSLRCLGTPRILHATLLTLISVLPATLFAQEVEVTIENVGPENAGFLTPVWVGFHQADFDSYNRNESADGFPGLEQIAEDGNTGPLSDSFASQVPGGVQGTIPGPNGPIFPGDKAVATFTLDASSHPYFSYVSMVIPSNDAFVANGNPRAHRVFDTNGNFTPIEFYILGTAVLDAGTEVNDEIPENVAALGQAAPNTGVTENGVVTNHPGFLAGGNILTAIPAGQFTLPGFVVAKVSVRLADRTEVRFTGDGSQETTPSGSTAIAACSAYLNSTNTSLTVDCDHNVVDATAAHIHRAPAGEDGPVVFPFEDPASPNGTFPVTENDVEDFLASDLYVNIHSDAYPGGEVRAQINGCFAGPSTLCLNDRRFSVTTTYETVEGATGAGQAVVATSESGQFTFFNPENVELDIKVLDACSFNNSYWVFAAGLTDVGVEITVTDTETGASQRYENAVGTGFEVVRDTSAFACQ